MVKVKIEKLIYEGWGIGKAENGKTIFVKKTVPGDLVEAEITKDKKSYAEATATSIIEPSPNRIKPPCPHFEHCGGCDHQNLAYKDQLKWKEIIFAETLARQGITNKPQPIVAASNEPYSYRNNQRFFFMKNKQGQLAFGMYQHDSIADLTEITTCHLQSETANKILEIIKSTLNKPDAEPLETLWQIRIREGKFTGEIMIELVTTENELPNKAEILTALRSFPEIKSVYHTVAPGKSLFDAKRRLLSGSLVIHEKIGNFIFQISPESFFQTNSLGVKTLYDTIKTCAEPKPSETILDLYCGTGTISIYLSRLAKKVTGVESVQSAIADAHDNARLNKILNCEFICADAAQFVDDLARNNKYHSPNTIVLDPPRSGLDASLIKNLSDLSWRRLVYVSCNPSTFARDIVRFAQYDIHLKKVQPVDMFPGTHHIECVGLLEKRVS